MTRRGRRPRGRLTECRDCAAPIVFVQLTSGGRMPVQPLPDPAGNVATRAIGGQLYGYVVSAAKPATPEHVLMLPHAAVCKSRPRRDTTPAGPGHDPDPYFPLF